ncbi:tetratricopeptide repeat protein [Acidobacteriota bacterium]
MSSEKEKARKDLFQKAMTAFEQAMKVFHKGDYKKASALLGIFLEKHNSENELVDRAKIYLEICDEHVKKDKVTLNTFDDYYRNGVVKANQGDYEEALKMLIKALSLEPKKGKTLYLLSSVYCLMDQPEKCLEHLERAVELNSHFAILAQNEEDFISLKEDEKFKLVTRVE